MVSTDRWAEAFWCGAMAASVILGVATFFASRAERAVWERVAVKSGHAEYVVDEGGYSVWQWKEINKETEE